MLLAEDLLLLMLSQDGKTIGRTEGPLSGAMLWELVAAECVSLDNTGLVPVLAAPRTRLDPLLVGAYSRLSAAGAMRKRADPIRRLLSFAEASVRERLIGRTMISAPAGRGHGSAATPLLDLTYRTALAEHLQAVIAGHAPIDPRSSALVAFLGMSGGIRRVTEDVRWPRIKAVSEDSWVITAARFVTGNPGSSKWWMFWE